jgi:hypothetical protein
VTSARAPARFGVEGGRASSWSRRHSARSRAPDARGLEVLHLAQRDGELLGLEVLQLRHGGLEEFLQARLQVAVAVQVRDHDEREALVALREIHELELADQVLLQRGLGRGDLGEVIAVVVAAARAAVGFLGEGEGFVRGGALLRLGLGGGRRGLTRGARGRRALLAGEFRALEQRIVGEVAFQLLVELDRRQLEQPDGLLQLGGEGEVLG